MKSKIIVIIVAFSVVAMLTAVSVFAGGAMHVSDLIWANDEIYDTIVTPATFNSPPAHSTDTFYNFALSGLSGQRPVSDSAPRDPGYNGGRWDMKMVVFTPAGLIAHDSDDDGFVNFELTSADQLLTHYGLGHFDIFDTGVYFECPLLPGNGN